MACMNAAGIHSCITAKQKTKSGNLICSHLSVVERLVLAMAALFHPTSTRRAAHSWRLSPSSGVVIIEVNDDKL